MPKTILAPDDIEIGMYFVVSRGPRHKIPWTQANMQMAMATGNLPDQSAYEEDKSLVGKVFRVAYFRPPLRFLIAEVIDKQPTGTVPQQVGPFFMEGPAPRIPDGIELDISELELSRVPDGFVEAYKRFWGKPDKTTPKPAAAGGSTRELMTKRAEQTCSGEQNNGASVTRDQNPR